MPLSKTHLLKRALLLALALVLIFLWLISPLQTVPDRTDVSIKESVNSNLSSNSENALQDSGSVLHESEMPKKELEQAERESLLNTLPTSLQDIPLPERLDIDDKSELVINLKIRRLFDFYLSALGEEELDTLVQRIQLDLQEQLPEPALSESLQILEGYLQYKNEIDVLRANSTSLGSGNIDDVLNVKQNLRASRSKFLSPEVALAFFAQEDQYDDYQIQKSRILGNQALSAEEQQAALANLKVETPSWLLEQEHSAQQITQYQKQLKTLQENNASEAEIAQLREQQFGSAATQRLTQLDQQRSDWDQRLATYRQELLQSVNTIEVGSDEFIRVSEEIRSQHYSGNELVRVRALDELYFAKKQ